MEISVLRKLLVTLLKCFSYVPCDNSKYFLWTQSFSEFLFYFLLGFYILLSNVFLLCPPCFKVVCILCMVALTRPLFYLNYIGYYSIVLSLPGFSAIPDPRV